MVEDIDCWHARHADFARVLARFERDLSHGFLGQLRERQFETA